MITHLVAHASDSTITRLAQAGLDAVPVPEAIARLVRLVAAAGSKYADSRLVSSGIRLDLDESVRADVQGLKAGDLAPSAGR